MIWWVKRARLQVALELLASEVHDLRLAVLHLQDQQAQLLAADSGITKKGDAPPR